MDQQGIPAQLVRLEVQQDLRVKKVRPAQRDQLVHPEVQLARQVQQVQVVQLEDQPDQQGRLAQLAP